MLAKVLGQEVNTVVQGYEELFAQLSHQFPLLHKQYDGLVYKFGGTVPCLFVHYGYLAITGRSLPTAGKRVALSWGLLSLYMHVFDRLVDEYEQFRNTVCEQTATALSLLYAAYEALRTEDGDVVMIQTALDELERLTRIGIDAWYQDSLSILAMLDRGYDPALYDIRLKANLPVFQSSLKLGMQLAGANEAELGVGERIGEQLSAAAILIDDLKDMETDFKLYSRPVTWPMFLVDSDGDLREVPKRIKDYFSKATRLANLLPYGARLQKVIWFAWLYTQLMWVIGRVTGRIGKTRS